MSDRGFIYFFEDAEAGLIKIGFSANVHKRLASLSKGERRPQLRLLAFYAGTKTDEKTEHERWQKHRADGEWFWPHADLIDYIGTIPKSHAKPATAPQKQDAYTERANQWVQYLEIQTRLRLGWGEHQRARASVAEESGVLAGTIENLRRGRLIHITCEDYVRLYKAYMREKARALADLVDAVERGDLICGVPSEEEQRTRGILDAARGVVALRETIGE